MPHFRCHTLEFKSHSSMSLDLSVPRQLSLRMLHLGLRRQSSLMPRLRLMCFCYARATEARRNGTRTVTTVTCPNVLIPALSSCYLILTTLGRLVYSGKYRTNEVVVYVPPKESTVLTVCLLIVIRLIAFQFERLMS